MSVPDKSNITPFMFRTKFSYALNFKAKANDLSGKAERGAKIIGKTALESPKKAPIKAPLNKDPEQNAHPKTA